MKYSIISTVAFACLAQALPQAGSPTTDPVGPPTNPPDAGGGGGQGGDGHGGRRGDRFALVLEVQQWPDMNGRFLRPQPDSSKPGVSWLIPNLDGESVSRRFAFEALNGGNSYGNVGYKIDRNSPALWTGFANTDRSNCQLTDSPVFLTTYDNTTSPNFWWINDGTWTSPTGTSPPTGPPTAPPETGPVDGAYWQRQIDPRDNWRCRHGPPSGGDNEPLDKFALCWIKLPDPVTKKPTDRLALHWHNTKIDDINKKVCWPVRVKLGGWHGPN